MKNQNQTITEYVVDAQNNAKAFDSLYDETIDSAYRYAKMYLKNEQDIEDVLQRSYMYLFRSISNLKEPESFEFWFHTIIRHECQKELNSYSRLKKITDAVIYGRMKEAQEWEVPSFPDDREDVILTVRKAVDGLPETQRMCVVMFYYDNMKISEIASELHVPEGTVKSRLYKAKKNLEKELKDNNIDKTILTVGVLPIAVAALVKESAKSYISSALKATILTEAYSGAAAGVTASVSVAGAAASSSLAIKATAAIVAATVAVGGGVATTKSVKNKVYTDVTTTFEETTSQEYNDYSEISELVETGTTKRIHKSKTDKTEDNGNTAESGSISAAASVSDESNRTGYSRTARTINRSSTQKRQSTVTESKIPETKNGEVSTTAPSVTSSTKAHSTTQKTTTQKATTQKPTQQKTKDPTVGYSVSAGVLKEYSGNESAISIPSELNISSIGIGAFSGNRNLNSVSLPSGVSKIGQEAFSECSNLSSVSLPSTLNSIGIGAFYGCSELSSVNIPSGTNSIGDEAFAECSSLKTIVIPSSVTKIGDDVFEGCNKVVIRCKDGSAAQKYAAENDIEIELM